VNDSRIDCRIACLIAIGAFIMGGIAGAVIFKGVGIEVRGQAIEHDAAYYHPQTGKFTWRDK